MPLVNRRAELKLRWTRYCILSASGNKNNINEDANVNNIIFTIKDTKIYVPVVTLSARDNQKLSKRLSKGFEGSVFWNEYKMKSDNKNTTNELINFLESNFVGVNRLFEFIQPIGSDIKRHEEIRILRTGQGEHYTTRCLLDYD